MFTRGRRIREKKGLFSWRRFSVAAVVPGRRKNSLQDAAKRLRGSTGGDYPVAPDSRAGSVDAICRALKEVFAGVMAVVA